MPTDPGAPDDRLPGEEPDLTQADEAHLAALAQRFLVALAHVRKGEVDAAAEELRGILKVEPRLAEPRIELARLLLETGQEEEAAEQTDEAIRILDGGGQWNDDLPEGVLKGLAWDLHGEALRRQADRDEVVFGDPERWRELVEQARAAFAKAAALDPDNAHAAYWAGGTDAELAPPEADDAEPVGLDFLLPGLPGAED